MKVLTYLLILSEILGKDLAEERLIGLLASGGESHLLPSNFTVFQRLPTLVRVSW